VGEAFPSTWFVHSFDQPEGRAYFPSASVLGAPGGPPGDGESGTGRGDVQSAHRAGHYTTQQRASIPKAGSLFWRRSPPGLGRDPTP
jgi:hypothetical protein